MNIISTSLALLPMSSPLPTTRTLQIPPSSSFLSSTVGIAPITHQQSSKGRSFVLGLGRRSSRRSKQGLTCNALFGLGVPELVVIAGVVALVFGPKQLPEVGRSIGKTVKSFQQDLQVQIRVASLVARMTEFDRVAQEDFAQDNMIRPLVILFSFETFLDEDLVFRFHPGSRLSIQ